MNPILTIKIPVYATESRNKVEKCITNLLEYLPEIEEIEIGKVENETTTTTKENYQIMTIKLKFKDHNRNIDLHLFSEYEGSLTIVEKVD